MTKLGIMLKAYCQKFDVTQESVAREIGLSASTMSRIVNEGKLPDADGIVKIMAWAIESSSKVS